MEKAGQATERTRAEAELKVLQRRFETWRRTTPEPRRIPDELWVQAHNLTRALATSRVTKALRLSYADFKRRMSQSRGRASTTGLVELRMPPVAIEDGRAHNQPIADVKKPDGVVLRLYVYDADILKVFLQA